MGESQAQWRSNVNEDYFTNSFSTSFRRRQNRYSLILFLLVLPIAILGTLYVSFLAYGNTQYFKYVGPGVLFLTSLYLLILHIRNGRWMNRYYKITDRGILLKMHRKQTQLLTWSSILEVDTGKLTAYDNSEITVIRCHLSSASSARLSPNIRNSGNENSIGTYYKLRHECFVLEYSSERLAIIKSQWSQVQKNGEKIFSGTIVNDSDFEFTFDSNVRGSTIQIKGVYIIGYYVAIVLWFGIRFLLNGLSDEAFVFLIILLGMPLVILYAFCSNQHAIQWLQTSKCKLCQDGIYLIDKKKREFIPWVSIVDVERKQMNLDAVKSVYVICLYQNLTSKMLMDRNGTQGTLHPMYSEFYHYRDEIITIGYTPQRLSRIRTWRAANI